MDLINSINSILKNLPRALHGIGPACRNKMQRTASYGNNKMKVKQNKKMACKMFGTEVQSFNKPSGDLELGFRYPSRDNLSGSMGTEVMIPKKIMSLIYEREKA